MCIDERIIESASLLCKSVERLSFAEPVHTVYNPLNYAWDSHREYLCRFAATRKKVVFLGMNPGPWGMAQTGVPFGEIEAVKNWMGIHARVGKPAQEHPGRTVEGFDCKRSEVSGRRLWGLFADRYFSSGIFFKDHFVANYCPLVFMAESGKNLTPDKLPRREREPLEAACNRHLVEMITELNPEWVVGVGAFAEKKAREALASSMDIQFGKILHPSPASPAANRDWAGQAISQMKEMGIWD